MEGAAPVGLPRWNNHCLVAPETSTPLNLRSNRPRGPIRSKRRPDTLLDPRDSENRRPLARSIVVSSKDAYPSARAPLGYPGPREIRHVPSISRCWPRSLPMSTSPLPRSWRPRCTWSRLEPPRSRLVSGGIGRSLPAERASVGT